MTTVLVTGARAPVALHLARLLHGAGHRVLLADSLAPTVAGASRLHHGFHLLPPPRTAPSAFAGAVAALVAGQSVDLVLPTCEEVFHLALARDTGAAIPLFAPGIGLLQQVHDKHRFIRTCENLGLEVPETHLLTDAAALLPLRDRAAGLVFKPVWSRFATRVLIRPAPRALKRLRPGPTDPWIAQEFLSGQEISAYAVAQAGRLTALALYRGLYRAGQGAAVAFAPVDLPAARAFVQAFVAGTGWTGQVSFDLMALPDGRVLPLECNPRATSGVHFFRDPAGLAAALSDPAAPGLSPDVTRPQGVRLALWLYGLPAALASGRLAPFRAALAGVEDVLDWPGDPGPHRAQWRLLAAMAARAIRGRCSLQAATTRDIEWNGPGDQSSI